MPAGERREESRKLTINPALCRCHCFVQCGWVIGPRP
nr:MAG TPA: hypothetical protein [Caudoviricetes sp.]